MPRKAGHKVKIAATVPVAPLPNDRTPVARCLQRIPPRAKPMNSVAANVRCRRQPATERIKRSEIRSFSQTIINGCSAAALRASDRARKVAVPHVPTNAV